MSAAVLSESGYTTVLDTIAESLVWRARLYTNDPTLSRDTVRADFTEVEFTGYDALPVERYPPSVVRDHRAWTVADALTWKYTSGPLPLPVRGIYCTAGRDGPLVWAWRRPGAAFQFSPTTPVLLVLVKLVLPEVVA